MSTWHPDRYPPAPLQAIVQRRVDSTFRTTRSEKPEHTAGMGVDRHRQGSAVLDDQLGIPKGTTARLLLRTADETLNWILADEWAIRLGLHPANIWPEWFGPDKCARAYRRELAHA